MSQQNIFEQIKHINPIGQEYWSARELFPVLDYIKWDKFLNVIVKAKEACKNSGQEQDDHFPRMEKLVEIGSGAFRDNKKKVSTYFRTRQVRIKANTKKIRKLN